MNADELRELADVIEPMGQAPRFSYVNVPAACAYLRACADALERGPVAWCEELRGDGSHGIPVSEWRVYGITQSKREADAHVRRCTDGIEGRAVPLYPVAMPSQPSSNPCQLPEPPHECKTEDEKRAFAFGWWKAMEVAAAPPPPAQQDDEALELLKLALEAMSCGDTGDDLEDSHRCGKCDEYVDRNAVVRQRIRALLAKRGEK